MGPHNDSEALGFHLARLHRRWASAAVSETARVLLYRHGSAGAHGYSVDQTALCGLVAYYETVLFFSLLSFPF